MILLPVVADCRPCVPGGCGPAPTSRSIPERPYCSWRRLAAGRCISAAPAFHSASSTDLKASSRLRRAMKGKALVLTVWLFGLRLGRAMGISGRLRPHARPPVMSRQES